MNNIRFKFDLKISTDQFCKIEHIFQTIHLIELEFYWEILYT
jgi:hypothetical protein